MNDKTAGWTKKEITSRLGISTAVYKGSMFGAREIAQIRDAGIKYIEISRIGGPSQTFDYRNRMQVKEIMAECRKQGVHIVSFHLPIDPCIPIDSKDIKQRRRAIDEILIIADILIEMGGNILVGHFNNNIYSKESLEKILTQLQNSSVIIAVENVDEMNIENVLSLIGEFSSEKLKLVLDVGHERDIDNINPFTDRKRAKPTVIQCENQLCHVHLHDTFRIKHYPDHRPPLHRDGIIQWYEIFGGLKEIEYDGIFMFENGYGENTTEWINMVGEFPHKLFNDFN